MALPSPLDLLAPDTCVCYGPTAEGCVCGDTERALRAYADGYPLPPMTAAQREWCLQEIDHVESFPREEYEHLLDSNLARGVLEAWVAYCQDLGLL